MTRACVQSFRDYVLTRPYGFGRGRTDSWSFIIFARGDAAFPDLGTWRDVRRYLEASGRHDLLEAARTVWGSYGIQKRRLARPPASSGTACTKSVETPLV